MSFLKTFLKDSVIYSLPAFLNKGISLFLVPLYTRVLSPADYGALDLLLAFGTLVNLTVAMEISQGAIWHVINAQNQAEKRSYASTALWFSLACNMVFLVISQIFASDIAPFILGASGHEATFRLASLYIVCNGLFIFLQNQLRSEMRSKSYTATNIAVSLMIPAFAITLTYGMDMGIQGVLTGMVIGTLLGAISSFWNLRNTFELNASASRLKQMLSYSLPLVPSGIAVFISYYIDRWMIQTFMTLEDVGLYGISYRVASIVALLIVGFRVALAPLILKHHAEEGTPAHLALIFRHFTALSFLLALGIGLFAPEILWLMTTPQYYSAADSVYILVPAMIMSNLYIFAPGIDIAKKTKIVMMINAAVAATSVFLSFILVPLYGVQGAALAALIKATILFSLYMHYSQKFYPVPHRWKPFLITFVGFVFLAIAGHELASGAWKNLPMKFLCVIVGVGIILASKLVKTSELQSSICFLYSIARKERTQKS